VAQQVPATAPVLETDSPDIPPHWIYRTAAERAALPPPHAQARNEPAELARIAVEMAALRQRPLADLAAQMRENSLAALPRLAALC
jgi:TatD DNase family protein